MRMLMTALMCLSLVAGCASSGPGGSGSGETRACPVHKSGDLCYLGPQGRQNKR